MSKQKKTAGPGRAKRRRKADPESLLEAGDAKLGHVPVSMLRVDELRPSPENPDIYRPVDPADPAVVNLAASIARYGLLEPLVVTADRFIVSGHNRHCAASVAGLEAVPCRVLDLRRDDDPEGYIRLLREHNRQRSKTRAEVVREAVIDADPAEAYQALLNHRDEQDRPEPEGAVTIKGTTHRCEISEAKRPMLDAICAIVEERRRFWPLSDRAIHYALCNVQPLKHASKPRNRYANNAASYKALTELLTRARLAGDIPMRAIDDPTRPELLWDVHAGVGAFLDEQLDELLKGYRRDLLQSQPDHIEIVGEKNTILPIIRPVAGRRSMPLSIGRGYTSLPPRNRIAERYRRSGKRRLVLLVMSDFDPEGEDIPHSLARSMRDDFGIDNVAAYKVGLTAEQVKRLDLPPQLKAKRSSARYKGFIRKHGSDDVYELEAVSPEQLQEWLSEAIDAALDTDAFNAELDAERQDAAALAGVRAVAHEAIAEAAESLEHGGDA